jgi:hypothetical protein
LRLDIYTADALGKHCCLDIFYQMARATKKGSREGALCSFNH